MSQTHARTPVHTAPYSYLHSALVRLRVLTVAALLLLTLVFPVPDGEQLPTWMFLALFAGYVVLIDWLKNHLPGLDPFTWVAILDLIVVSSLYAFRGEPLGPLVVLFFLAVICAVVSMSLRLGLLYTGVVALVMAAVTPLLPGWSPTLGDIRELGVHIILVVLFGVGTAILAGRLSREQEAARAARDEAGQLEELDRLRSDFISSVSHELRTPLTSARAGLGMLEVSGVDQLQPEQRELLANARSSVESLGMLIDDLLTLNQLEAGTLSLDCEPLDLRAAVADAISVVHPLMQEKGQILEADLPELLSVEGDSRRLAQVFVNVLANAHWHTQRGTRVMITNRSTADEMLVAVSDNGPGIPGEELDMIFQRFYRLARGDGGSGLGLAIARNLIELHGGRMWAESRPGKGASFYVALPRYRNGVKL